MCGVRVCARVVRRQLYASSLTSASADCVRVVTASKCSDRTAAYQDLGQEGRYRDVLRKRTATVEEGMVSAVDQGVCHIEAQQLERQERRLCRGATVSSARGAYLDTYIASVCNVERDVRQILHTSLDEINGQAGSYRV